MLVVVPARRSPVWSLLAPCLLAAVAALPVGWIAIHAAAALRNIAYWDEIDSTIALLLRLDSGIGIGQFLQNLFSITNEHRTVTSRLMFAGSYWLTGTVDFKWLGVIGNGFLLAACALLVAGVRDAARRLRLAVVLALVLFQLQNYESFFWSGSSIDHFQVVALAVGAIVALAHGSRAGVGLAVIGAILATFTLAHGLVVWPVGALMLARERRWRQFAAWSALAVLTSADFFVGFTVNPGHRLADFSSSGAATVFRYWLSVLGSPLALKNSAAAPWLGAALLVTTIGLSVFADWRRHRVTLPVIWFAIGAAALIAIGRAELSHGQVYSRYLILGGFAWALAAFALIERWSSDRRPFVALACCLPALATFNVAANRAFREDAETFVERRDRAALRYRQNFEDGKGPATLYPVPARATAVLAEAARRNIYRVPRICVTREFPDAKPSSRISYFVDEFSVNRQALYLSGWAAIPAETIRRGELHVVLRSAETFRVYSTIQVRRPDVVAAFNEPRWRMAGFRFGARRSRIPPGEYQVGFLIGNEEDAEYILTDHRLNLVGVGEARMAQAQ